MKEDTYDVEISSVIAKTRGQYRGASFIIFCLVDYKLSLITIFGIEDQMIPSPLCWGEQPIRHCTPQSTMTTSSFVYYLGQYHYHSASWHISK